MRKAVEERLSREKSVRSKHEARHEEEKRREFEVAWAKIQKIQEEVRKHRLAENMLTDDDLYDENGLPK